MPVAPERIVPTDLMEIYRKVDAGQRLSVEDGVLLFQHPNLTAVGYMGNNTLPARAGELMRVVMLGGPRRAVFGTVVAERLLDVCALAAIFAFVVVERGVSFGPLPYLVAFDNRQYFHCAQIAYLLQFTRNGGRGIQASRLQYAWH